MLSARTVRDEPVFLWIVSAWFCALLYFNPRILALAGAVDGFAAKAAVVLFVVCLDIFWLHAVYNVTMIVASAVLRKTETEPALPPPVFFPKTAVLYATRNDFRPECAESCVRLDYPDFRVFILDDGTTAFARAEVDRWAAGHPERVSVIRRDSCAGYKAGNLNHALRRLKDDFPYFAVCDADGLLPADFILKLLPYFEAHPDAAFVQAVQRANPRQSGAFGRALGHAVASHYRHFVKARNRFGFVMFYGHGALLKTSVWEEAGGFPEIVTEDLAFAAKARTLGYRGYYTERVACDEDFPPTFARLRTRSEKWIRGTGEFIKTGYAAFLRSRRVTWFEKLDVLIGALTHYQSLVMLVFLALLGAVLPVYYAHFRYPGSYFLMPVPHGKSALEYLAHIRYHIFWSPDFYLMMALTFLGPALPAILDLRRRPAALLRHLSASQFIFMASLVAEAAAALAFLTTGRARFRNTHDAAETAGRGWKSFHPNHPIVSGAEVLTGGVLLWMGLATRNLWFMVPASGLLAAPWVDRLDWDRAPGRLLAGVPFGIGALVFGLVSLDLAVSWSGAR